MEEGEVVEAEGMFAAGLDFGFEGLAGGSGEVGEEGGFGAEGGGRAGAEGGDALLFGDGGELGWDVDGS